MTPTTATRPSSIPLMSSDRPADLASQPLLFTTRRNCKNKEVQNAVIESLTDKSCSDQLTVTILKNAFLHGYQPELNQLIRSITERHGSDAIAINKNVTSLLADEGIELIQNSNQTVQISPVVIACTWQERHELILATTEGTLPAELATLISSFDDEIDIGKKNQDEILGIFMSGDCSAKGLLIAAGSHQNKIPYLNDVFAQFRSMHLPLNLAGVDLSGLDLTGINLSGANLGRANLSHARLNRAQLPGAVLSSANLNQCDLSSANLISANLRDARLIGAKLLRTLLNGASLTNSCMVCADLRDAEMGASMTTGEAIYNYANMKNIHLIDSFKIMEPVFKRLENDCTAYIVPIDRQRPETRYVLNPLNFQQRRNSIVIDESEKAILLNHGIAMTRTETAGRDGVVWHCSREVVAQEDHRRHQLISATLEQHRFPRELSDLIASYDDDIEISERNRKAIIKILQSGDPTAKRLLIASASAQNLIAVLNNIFKEFRNRGITLDLSSVDLSDLNLTGICLIGADLCHANLQNSVLNRAQLHNAKLVWANLNGATLNQASLHRADLSCARLIGATLIQVVLRQTNLTHAVLMCANILTPDLNQTLRDSEYRFAQIVRSIEQSPIDSSEQTQQYHLPCINTPLDAIIVPDAEYQLQPSDTRSRAIVITESEKGRLLAAGIKFDDNDNGTFQLSRATRYRPDPKRATRIDSTLHTILPKVLTDLISDYDAEIDVSETNEGALLHILTSGNQTKKGQLIATASRQSRIPFLNTLFTKMKQQNKKLDLSGVDLCNLRLHGIHLDDANLSGAIMIDCDLYQATLRYARLSNANLNGASLQCSDLTRADLSDARLMHADLTAAILIGAKLQRAMLKCANLTKADLQGETNLQGAYLDYANLENANFDQANLAHASLTCAKLLRTRLDRANLYHAFLMHAELVYASLMSTNLTGANLSDTTLHRVTLIGNTILIDTIWTGATFHEIFTDLSTKKKLPLRMWMHCR